ncbi:DUF4177 domain-containing protein [Rhodovulum euryhalinum]|uniref:Uncharacterized protein DUF4177 n=1 Tax=Rhodovulum euryhalinum TaxID=35805 RepID=A0A4R2KRG6_9RHOB|nr:DUF4177 domain-containing protein [Rhodovulum euryhalinum]TCO69215.1 uncharacterized protein DUF4177 [Rhodovulum euryhalinum]
MTVFEYKVLPAPERARRAKGASGTGERFAVVLTEILNAMAAEGWEYLRAESLPCVERKGLTGRVETTQTMLVFRRPRAERGALPQAASPEEIAAAAAASLSPDPGHGLAPSLGAARRDPVFRAIRPLGPARDDEA